MERFHYCFATDFAVDLPDLTTVSTIVRDADKGFVHNVLRIQSLGRLPILLVGAATVTQTFEMLARFELGIKQGDVELITGHPSFNPERYKEKEDLRIKMNKRWFADAVAGRTASGMTIGEVGLAAMATVGGSELEEAIEAVLSGMVTGLWTSFEVLAEDLWESVVKLRPAMRDNITEKEWKQCGFRSIKKLRSLYWHTFKVDGSAIFEVLNDATIEALALVRNLIVHKGGLVDEEFDKRRKDIASLALFSATSKGQKIALTGRNVHDMLRPVTILAFKLVRAVDFWFTSHP